MCPVFLFLALHCNRIQVVLTRMSRQQCRHLKSPQSLKVSSASMTHSGCHLHRGILLTPIPFVPWQSGLLFPRYNLTFKIQFSLKFKGQCQNYPIQRSVLLTHFLSVSHQGILSTPVPSLTFWLPIPEIQFDHDNSRLKVPLSVQCPVDSFL